jgi:Pyridoxamine 5'-phosphate oxidase
MAKTFPAITPDLAKFIAAQQIYFVASAPLAAAGHVNISPKGLDSLRILSPQSVAYLDLTGSGNETSAHLQENGRLTLMFCAFQEPPMILRLYGQGRTILPESPDWPELACHFPTLPGSRQIIVLDIERVQTSCGMGVPLYDLVGHRQGLLQWAQKKGADGMAAYQRDKNRVSIDGLPTPLGARLN